MARLSIQDARKTYPNGVHAINGIDLEVADGEFVVLVGPSGCGKSTLLRMIAGLEQVTSGTIKIDDRRVNDLEPADRDIAMVFQNYALYPHMSVFNNMAYGLRNRGTPRDEIEKRVTEAARLLEIEALLDRRPRQLSGGQRQRVAMGRAIVRKPAAFLFDEPLSNLDAKLRVQMRVEIKKLQRDLGTTSIYVTHDQVEAMTMADRLVVMNGGVAEQIGTPREVYQKPATEFVAGFIGSPSMNFIDGHIGGDRRTVVVGSSTLALPAASPLEAATPVVVGIRPEDLAQGQGQGPLVLAVEHVEHLGTDTILHGPLQGVGKGRIAYRVHGDVDFKIGALLDLAVAPASIHMFDKKTARRVA
ncbi:MAG: sn-glycerol-3-phosphate import ATP-binding protein UgpC [Hyphomicrobiaceae bacterium]